jgi:hypothetical protein
MKRPKNDALPAVIVMEMKHNYKQMSGNLGVRANFVGEFSI